MSRLTDAYVAGLVDGEGCILIQESRGPTYHHLVTVGMTAKALSILEALQAEYGGKTKKARDATERWDTAYSWTVAGDQATDLLERIRPHLILKSEQARVALKVAEIRRGLPPRWESSPDGQRMWTDRARQRCATLKRRIHELNAKGPSADPEPPWPGARPIARRVAGHWVTDQHDLFSDLGLAPFSEPWPASGSMRGGVLYPLPPSVSAIGESVSSSSPRAAMSTSDRGDGMDRLFVE